MELGTSQSTSQEVSYSVTNSAGFSAFGATFDLSVGLGSSNLYEVTVGSTTVYEGVIGGILSGIYPQWSYDVGMIVYTLDDHPEFPPVQVLDYWTTPTGTTLLQQL